MNIPKYWVRARAEVQRPHGDRLDISAWGWSATSRAEAEQKAHERLSSLANRVQQGEDLPKGYGYGNRPLREEIVDELSSNGDVIAMITRNSYGSLILNTSSIMFVDIDVPQESQRSSNQGGLLGRLFGKEKQTPPPSNREVEIRDALRNLASNGSFRLYRTAGGFRILATDPLYVPGSAEAEEFMKRTSADTSFVQLCRAQRSFRARLTPKPWRCGHRLPPGEHPRENESDKRELQQWIEEYNQKCASKATCKFLQEVGPGEVHDFAKPVLELHDRMTHAHDSLPLA